MQKITSAELSNLSVSVIKRLTQNRIVTILDFLEENVEKLSGITKLNLPQILSVRNEIFVKYSAPLVNGTSLLVQSLVNRKLISTGIESVDGLQGGGIPVGFITEICGLADSGKSQLCFQIAINVVKSSNDSILYIDTKGDFSAVRIQKILEAYKYSHKDMALIMYKIRVIHLWTMGEVVELLECLKDKTLVIENLALIIIDSLPCLMFQHIGDESKVGLSYLNTLVNHARFLCRELHLAMICVNVLTRWVEQGVGDIEDDREPSTIKENYTETRNRCLGKYWQHIPVSILLLEKKSSKEETITHSFVTISLMRSNTFGSKKCVVKERQCILKISAFGVT